MYVSCRMEADSVKKIGSNKTSALEVSCAACSKPHVPELNYLGKHSKCREYQPPSVRRELPEWFQAGPNFAMDSSWDDD